MTQLYNRKKTLKAVRIIFFLLGLFFIIIQTQSKLRHSELSFLNQALQVFEAPPSPISPSNVNSTDSIKMVIPVSDKNHHHTSK